jgi:4-azaleucine resistance transporter AzlC
LLEVSQPRHLLSVFAEEMGKFLWFFLLDMDTRVWLHYLFLLSVLIRRQPRCIRDGASVVDIEVSVKANSFRPLIKDGLKAAWPICLGYFPIGAAFGVLAQQAGLYPVEIILMSLLVFAGSSQFIAVSLISAGATIVPIVATTFVVNLRHLLMSSSLALYLRSISKAWLALFAYGVTDESFAVNLTRFRDEHWEWRQALVVNHTANASWIASTILGIYCGQFIPAGAFGIDYALIAMFLALLVFQLRGRLYTAIAIISGLLAVILALLIPGNAYIIIASVLAATIGVILQRSKITGRLWKTTNPDIS